MNRSSNVLWGILPPLVITLVILYMGLNLTLMSSMLLGFICLSAGGIYAGMDFFFMKGLEQHPKYKKFWDAISADQDVYDRRLNMWITAAMVLISGFIPDGQWFILFSSIALIYSCLRHWIFVSSVYEEYLTAE